MIEPPILIFVTSLSGSSMVTGIFRKHGVWVGTPKNRKDYQTWENESIKSGVDALAIPKQRFDGFRGFHSGLGHDDVRKVVERIVPPDTRWVFKTGIDSWALWDGVFDGTKPVFVQRKPESVAESNRRRAGRDYDRCLQWVRERYAFMDKMAAQRGIPIIKSDELVVGDYSSIERAFDYCGLMFNPKTAASCIEPKRFHC